MGYNKEHYKKNKSKYKEYFKKYYQKNKVKLKIYNNNRYHEKIKNRMSDTCKYSMKNNRFKSRRENTLKFIDTKINYNESYTFEELMNKFLFDKELVK